MEKVKRLFMSEGLWAVLFCIVCSVFGVVDGGLLAANVSVPLVGGGVAGIDEMTSVTRTTEDSENLLVDHIEKFVTKIQPYNTVLNTISRYGDKKDSNSQIARHYSTDVLPVRASLSTAIVGGTNPREEIVTSDNGIFATDDTIFCLNLPGYMPDGVTPDPDSYLMLHVKNMGTTGNPVVEAVNGQRVGTASVVPAIPVGTELLRAGRAGYESQIQTDAYSVVPTDDEQFLQKFMMQIEETTLHKIVSKEVNWNFSDQEERALYDFKRTQNYTFWIGKKRRTKELNKRSNIAEDVFYTEGVWWQAGKEFSFNGANLDIKNMVALMKTAFTGNDGAQTKFFIVGSDFMERIETMEYNRIVKEGTEKQIYGIRVTQIISRFGTLNVVHDQSLNDLGMSDCGFILDPDYLRKLSIGWRTKDFDLRTAGVKDADSRVFIEICGLVLKNPGAHLRVMAA